MARGERGAVGTLATLHLTLGPGGLSLGGARRGSASAPLPSLPEAEFFEDLACLAPPPPQPREDAQRRALRQRLAEKGGPQALGPQVGGTLFGLLFPTEKFRYLYRQARENEEGLRLLLEFLLEPPDPTVARWAALPWEYLWDPQDRAFLAALPDVSLIRRLGAGQRQRSFQGQAPLRVLALLAEPWGQPPYGREEALRALVGELQGHQLAVRVLSQPIMPALANALAEYKPQVLHVVAHGDYDPQTGGHLALEDEFGGTDPVAARDFAGQVAGAGVRLVTLSSCHSGAGEGASDFQGVAQALLGAGLPAVVAMQYSVPVVTAHRFTGSLYRALSQGQPLDQAVSLGRQVLKGTSGLPPLDWAIPVFYLQADRWSIGRGQGGAAPQVEDERPPTNLTQDLRPAHFLGRDEKMVELAWALRRPLAPRRFVTVTGLGGVGKTALAAAGAFWHWERAYFPAGVLWASARGATHADLLLALGRALGIPEFDKRALADQEAALLGRLEKAPLLLAIDNADGLRDDPAFRLFLGRINPSSAGRVLVTCRRRLDIDGERDVDLGRLPPDDATALFLALWGVEAPTPQQVGEAARLCGRDLLEGHPLAIVIAARVARKERLSSLAGLEVRLRERMAETLRHRLTPEEELSLEACLGLSYEALGETAREMLRRLWVFQEAFREEAAQALGGELPAWRDGLVELMEHRLLDKGELETSKGTRLEVYRMHPVVRGYGQALAGEAAPLRLAAGRFLASTDFINENLEGIRHLEAAAAWGEVIQAAIEVEGFLDLRGMWAQDGAVLQAGLRAARELGARANEGNFLGELGSNHLRLGEARKAIEHYEQALDISREIKDKRMEGNALGSLGNAHFALGEARQAIDYHQQALAISREIKDKRMEGNALGSLGLAYADLGEARQAIGYYEQALAIGREIKDRRGEGASLGNLGLAYADLGEARQAIGYYEQALAISREIGDRRGEGNHLGNLGNAYLELGDYEGALGHLLPALLLLGQVESPDAAVVARNIARLQEKMGEGPFRALAQQLAKETGVLVSVEEGEVRLSQWPREGG